MPTRNAPFWNPWKILLGAGLGCAFAFAIFVAAAVYWVTSAREQPGRTIEKRPTDDVARITQPAAKRQRNEQSRNPSRPSGQERGVTNAAISGLTNGLTAPQLEKSSVGRVPAKPVKNAILASRNPSMSSLPGDDLFKDAHIPSLQIEIPAEGVAGLRRSARRYVRATIREGATAYTNVAVHLKGGPGSYRQLNDIPSFTLNFDRFAQGQTFHGLKKIHLNNSVQDGSFLSEKISRELFEAAGVPAPRAGNAKVKFNGRELGLYVLVEGVNKQFLHRYFKDVKGNVYDGHSGTDVTDPLPTNGGEDPDRSGLHALAEATREPLDTRLASLEKTLDMDRFLSFVAMEAILGHWDGYTMNRNNFRIFHDRDSDRMVFLPHGLDQILGRPKGPILPEKPVGLVARSVLEIPEARRLYRERAAQLSTNVFRGEAIVDRIHEIAEKIDAVLMETDPRAAKAHAQRVSGMCRKFQERAKFLQQQVSPASLVKFDELARAPLTNWQSKLDLGDALLTQEKDNEGKPLLHISTKNGCTASWRTSRLLDAGKYRFEARLKTEGVMLAPDDPRAGAGLRISRFRGGQKNSGNRDWTATAFDFEVPEEQTEVELVCELRALQGDVWFDLKSLKLRRL